MPLPQPVLDELGRLWWTHRNRRWLFPNHYGDASLNNRVLSRTFAAAAVAAGIPRGVTPPQLPQVPYGADPGMARTPTGGNAASAVFPHHHHRAGRTARGAACQSARRLRRADAGSAAAIIELARDPRCVGGTVDVLAVLHTWTQQLNLNPQTCYPALSFPAFSVNKASWSFVQPPCKISLPVRWRQSIILRMGSASKSLRRISQGARGVSCSGSVAKSDSGPVWQRTVP